MVNCRVGTEDYTDWESVDEETEPEPPSRAKGKRKAVSVKKEDENTEVPAVLESKDNMIEDQQPPQDTPAPEVKKKQSKTNTKTKPQKGLLNFFGPKRN